MRLRCWTPTLQSALIAVAESVENKLLPQLSTEEIRSRLALSFTANLPPENPYPVEVNLSTPRSAAVLTPLFQENHEWKLLFIRRTFHENDLHSGQVAFPGGRCEPQDPNPETTALREAAEEVGIQPQMVDVLGRLRDMLTISHYRVSPIVGKIPWPKPLTPQPDEVSRIFSIPLAWLADPKNRDVHFQTIPILGKTVPVIYFKPFDGEILWGATARITILLLEALGLADPRARYSPTKPRNPPPYGNPTNSTASISFHPNPKTD